MKTNSSGEFPEKADAIKPAKQLAESPEFDSGYSPAEIQTTFDQWTEQVMEGMRIMHEKATFLADIQTKTLTAPTSQKTS